MNTPKRPGPPTIHMPDLKWYDYRQYMQWQLDTLNAQTGNESVEVPANYMEWANENALSPLIQKCKRRTMRTAELKWFDVKKYDPHRLAALDLSGWTNLLFFRFLLRIAERLGPPGAAMGGFEIIQRNPFDSDGMELPTEKKLHFADSSSVTFARAAPLAALVERVLFNEMDGSEAVSPALAALYGEAVMSTVIVQVDLRARRTQIRKDFAAWLKKIDLMQVQPVRRDYSRPNAFHEWRKSKYLQCFDLDLFAELNDARIPAKVIADVLELEPSPAGESRLDMVRVCRGCHDAFTPETVRAMVRQCVADAQSIEGPDGPEKPVSRKPRSRRPNTK